MVRPPRRRGGKANARVLSKDLTPVLFAADRSGTTLGAALDSARAAEIADALCPVRGEGCRAGRRRGELLPALRSVARIVPHRSEPIRRTANPGSLPHPDGRQSAKPLQGIPVPLPRRRDEIPRKLPPVMPARLPRRKRKPVNLPRSRRQFGMHTNRKMSHFFTFSAIAFRTRSTVARQKPSPHLTVRVRRSAFLNS